MSLSLEPVPHKYTVFTCYEDHDQRDFITNLDRSCLVSCFVRFNEKCTVFVKFNKTTNTKFHENSSGGSRSNQCGQTYGRTDGHDESNSYFSQLLSIMSKHWNKIYGFYVIKQVHIALSTECLMII